MGAVVRGGRPGTLLSVIAVLLTLPDAPKAPGGDMLTPAVERPSREPPFSEPMEPIEPAADSSSFRPFLPPLHNTTQPAVTWRRKGEAL